MFAFATSRRSLQNKDRARPPAERTFGSGALLLALIAEATATLFGCSGDRSRAPPASTASAASSTNPAGAANSGAANFATADAGVTAPIPSISAPSLPSGRSDRSCVAPFDAASSHVQLRAARGQIVLGVIAGLKDASDENVAHLRALVAELQRRGAELLIVDGDLGDNSDAQESLLTAVTSNVPPFPLPTLVVAGNREIRTDLDEAESSVRHRGVPLADLSHTRAIDLGDVLIVGLPGVFDRRLLRADGACTYAQPDLDAIASYLDKLPASTPPALLVAAVPPRGDGKLALDFSDGQNVGDARFAPLLTPARARFGIFGEVWEAGGRAIDGAGHPVAQGTLSNSLYLNPGAADRTPWPMNDGTTQTGLAALVTIRGRQASFETIREPPAPARPP